MVSRRLLLQFLIAFFGLSLTGSLAAQPSQPTHVVATFSILGDMVKRIGGKHVALTTLVGPNGDTHVYQPTPAAARAVRSSRSTSPRGLTPLEQPK